MMTISQLREQHNDAASQAIALRARLMGAASSEGRPLGPGETQAINAAVARANDLKAQLDRAQGDVTMAAAFDTMTHGMATRPASSSGRGGSGHSLSQQILNSEMGRWLLANKGRFPTGAWTSPSSELPAGIDLMAATLSGDPASGGALVLPDSQPGILSTPTRPLVMADLIAPGVTTSNLVSYMRETAFDNAADTVPEGGTKPESTLTFDAVSDPVRKIAHWLPITEEMLEDVPALGGYIDTRLRLGVQLAEDDQLLNGSIVAPDIVGFLNRTGLAPAIARGTDSNADAVLKQIAAIFVSTNLQPTGIVMNPSNWLTIQLLKLTTGEYASGNGPFSAPQVPTLWGVPVALTSAMAAGTALVGAFKTASQLFRKGGLRVEASNSHQDFFTKNLVAIRAEERLALAVYRPAAFGTVTGLN